MKGRLLSSMAAVRMSEKDYRRIQSPARSARTRAEKPVVRTKRSLEAVLTKQVIGFLRLHQWQCVRTNSGLLTRPNSAARIRIGAPGMADWLCIRRDRVGMLFQVFWLELKSRGNAPSDKQYKFLAEQRALGFPAVWLDHYDADGVSGSFRDWYDGRYA